MTWPRLMESSGHVGTNLQADGKDMVKSCQVGKSLFQAKSKMLSCHHSHLPMSLLLHFLGTTGTLWFVFAWLTGWKEVDRAIMISHGGM